MPNTPNVPVVKDEIDAALEKAKLEARRQRRVAIGSLLDKATDVLSDVLDTTDQAHEGARMRAAEIAVNLYMQSENGERQDRVLDVQERRIQLEEAKLLQATPQLNQQNNFYLNAPQEQPKGQEIKEETPEEHAAALRARKQVQDMILKSYLAQAPAEQEVTDETTTNKDVN